MSYITAAQLHGSLSNVLKIRQESMPSFWEEICVQAADFATREVQGRLLGRGFLPEVVLAWDRDYEFSRDLGIWKAVMLGGAYSGFDPNVLKAFDRTKELDSVLVSVGNVWVQPTGNQASLTDTGVRDDMEGLFGLYPGHGDFSNDPMHW